MTQPYTEKYKPLGESVAKFFKGASKISAAYNAVESLKECPENCEGSKISVQFNDGSICWVACPVLSQNCSRGEELHAELKTYCLASIKAVPGMPGRFHESLGSPRNTDAVFGGKSWAQSPQTFLVFYGGHGTGKSFGAAYALYALAYSKNANSWENSLKWNPINAMWVSAYRATTRDDLFEEARTKPVLVLDDLGAELPTNVARYKIAEIISERNNHKRLTILTMNDDPQELSQYGDNRVADRVFGDGKTVYCGGESLRLSA